MAMPLCLYALLGLLTAPNIGHTTGHLSGHFAGGISGSETRPKLVLVISIDQFRADYIRRYGQNFLPAKAGNTVGGFEYLMQRGADYADAHHAHVPTATGPGHAAILTGSAPSLNGIIANDWFDPATGKSVYCVDDVDVKTIGGTSGPMSPKNLWVTTVGDEMKLATNGHSHVVGISFKDRAAILLAGHAADTVIWLDNKTQNWVSSSWYCAGGTLPTWVTEVNGEHAIAKDFGKAWEPLLPSAAYAQTQLPGFETPPADGKPFSHPIATDPKAGVRDFTTSNFGQEYLFKTVERSLAAEKLGQHDAPDLLAVNLATNDYVGHAYGPDSPEAMDITVRTDRLLSHLFNALDKQVPGGLSQVVIAITADHGVVPIPEDAQSHHIPAKRFADDLLDTELEKGMETAYGPGKWVLAVTEPNLYLNDALIAEKKLNLARVRRTAAAIACKIPGVFIAFTAEEIMSNQLPAWQWTSEVSLGYNPKRGGDLIIVPTPGDYVGGGGGTGHGTPWAYDHHVPLLLVGPGIHPGRYYRHVLITDLAPTLCQLLGVEYPSGNIGEPLREALGDKAGQ